jgi:hypothetical protein
MQNEPEPERSCVTSSIDELLENSAAFAAEFADPSSQVPLRASTVFASSDSSRAMRTSCATQEVSSPTTSCAP